MLFIVYHCHKVKNYNFDYKYSQYLSSHSKIIAYGIPLNFGFLDPNFTSTYKTQDPVSFQQVKCPLKGFKYLEKL